MNPAILLVLEALASLFGLQGQTKTASTILKLIAAAKGGLDVDAHMKKVADDLSAGIEPDWDNVVDRIEADSRRLHDD